MSGQLNAKYVFVGGGVAAAQASVGMRQVDTEGSAIIVCSESWWPYDRPPLSKNFLTKDLDPSDVESKDPSFYEQNNIQVMRGRTVVSADTAAKKIKLDDGTEIGYEKLLLATGSTPKKPHLPGVDLKGVHTLRTVNDSMAIKEGLQSGKNAVMVGAGYIGMEVGSAAMKKGLQTTIIDPSSHPWSKFASEATGNFLRRYYEKKGASMMMGEEVESLVGDGSVRAVKTKSGKEIPADVVVVGVGISQNLDLPKSAGLQMDDKEGVVANEFFQTSDPNVYVAGDIAALYDPVLGKRWHAEHYLHGQWTGKQAGRNMAGANEKYEKVPYFFSDMQELGMILRGDPQAGKSAKTFGDVDSAEFVELYAREDGSLAMGMGFSLDSKRLDAFSDKLEELIPQRPAVAAVDGSSFGF
jgi:3-phenylpropionate/trans-cinnamate dioxygenase ferredoxin reductase subunit